MTSTARKDYGQAHHPGSTSNILIAIAFQRDAAVLYRMARSHGGQHGLAFQRKAATVSRMARQAMEIEP